MLRTLWLFLVVVVLWVLWCIRNDKFFNKKSSTTENCLFQAKLRSLIWLKTAKGTNFGELDGWWYSPRSALVVNPVKSRSGGTKFRFTVVATIVNNLWGYGGALVFKKGELRAIFLAHCIIPIEAIQLAILVFLDASCFDKDNLDVEIGSSFASIPSVKFSRHVHT
ncbi:hypothetical protein V6N11_004656 [Hibiscus sabdariffa]|uniref:RNase H type-1 domain-containing protein n=1 Tax=Hibiscus sabdariffa TaxID=183260 RepID=A0ABR2SH77_9ROSI